MAKCHFSQLSISLKSRSRIFLRYLENTKNPQNSHIFNHNEMDNLYLSRAVSIGSPIVDLVITGCPAEFGSNSALHANISSCLKKYMYLSFFCKRVINIHVMKIVCLCQYKVKNWAIVISQENIACNSWLTSEVEGVYILQFRSSPLPPPFQYN